MYCFHPDVDGRVFSVYKVNNGVPLPGSKYVEYLPVAPEISETCTRELYYKDGKLEWRVVSLKES